MIIGSILTNFPWLVVDSAIALSSSNLSSNHCLTFTASTTESVLIAGALVILSPITLALAPPAAVIAEQPLLTEANNAPSDVARGTKKSSFAYFPLTFNGPATPIGIWTVPIGFSMFFANASSISKV